eukprot:TRINITY_DN14692_c0_g1_i1.p1 TRINITY_DN14692_c0_g1~~TRINITY_DN14692_c0_g1_i1.p1  ORF type:complete len:117 (+),score=10.73 TRINITY_DN14692_c0_g1_i1:93-443(+)
MIRRPPRSTLSSSSAASDVYKRQYQHTEIGSPRCHMYTSHISDEVATRHPHEECGNMHINEPIKESWQPPDLCHMHTTSTTVAIITTDSLLISNCKQILHQVLSVFLRLGATRNIP